MPPRESLTVRDLSDRELLQIAMDTADAAGWFSVIDVMEMRTMKNMIRGMEVNASRSISLRFSWLQRYDVLERQFLRDENGNIKYIRGDQSRPRYAQRWRLTPDGEAFALGTMNQRQARAIERLLSEGKMVDVTRIVATTMMQAGGGPAFHLTRRQWTTATNNGRRR